MRDDEIVAEIETVCAFLRENPPKAKNADHRLKLLVRRIVEGK